MNEPNPVDVLNAQLQQTQLRNINLENQYSSMSGYDSQKNQDIIAQQLDLKQELDSIYHLLSGHIIKIEDGNEAWGEPNDDRLKILSDYGVKQLMNIISFYINKNTLLSNFNEETIFWKVRDFGIELADLMFCRYEHFFYYPTPEDLYDKYLPYFQEEIIQSGNELDTKELYFKCVQWSNEELRTKFRHFPIILQALVDSIHTTMLRALNGEERKTLRTQYNVHQSYTTPINGNTNESPSFKLTRPSSWGAK